MIAFLETTGERHLQLIGGVTALERKIREAAKTGATKAVVAAPATTFPRALPIPVEFVERGTPAPEGAQRMRADVIADVDLVDAEACARAEWALIRRMNKSFQGPVDATINWRVSMRITRRLSHLSLAFTPNHITVTSILVGLTAAVVAGVGTYAAIALGGVLLQVQSILDSCDGELARLRFQYSKVGQWLDNLSDDLVDNAFVAGVGVALGGVWLVIALAGVAARVVVALYIYISVYRRTGTGDIFAFRWWFEGDAATPDEVFKPSLRTYLRSLGRRDTYVFLWMIVCLASFPEWVVGHAAVIGAVYAALMLLQLTVFRRPEARRT